MRKDEKAVHLKALIVTNDNKDAGLKDEAKAAGLEVHTIDEVIAAGKSGDAPEFTPPAPEDFYIFSYTSGTTGDSKGVKLSHN